MGLDSSDIRYFISNKFKSQDPPFKEGFFMFIRCFIFDPEINCGFYQDFSLSDFDSLDSFFSWYLPILQICHYTFDDYFLFSGSDRADLSLIDKEFFNV